MLPDRHGEKPSDKLKTYRAPSIPDNRGMNPLLAKLQPYPFERLKQLFASVTPDPALRHISLGIGEPKHATPAFIQEALKASARQWPLGLPSDSRRAQPAQGLRRLVANTLQLGPGPTHPVVAGERLARSPVCPDTNRDRPDPARCHGGQPQPLLPNLRRRGLAVRG